MKRLKTWCENTDNWTLPQYEFDLDGDPRPAAVEQWTYFLHEFFTEGDRNYHPEIDYEAVEEFHFRYAVSDDYGTIVDESPRNIIRHVRGDIISVEEVVE
jgi:hypothetical protein